MAGPVKATLSAVGNNAPGQTVAGIAAGYQLEGEEIAEYGDITPYDSGGIIGTVPPGKPGIKLVDGTQQRAAQIISTRAKGAVGNALTSTYSIHNVDPVPNVSSNASSGLSLTPEHE